MSVEEVRAATGTVGFHAYRIVFQDGQDDQNSTLVLTGHVGVTYHDQANARSMSLTAQNAVVFLAPGVTDLITRQQMDVSSIRGVYLEENVILTDGKYTVRAPRVYYDLHHDKAIVLDAGVSHVAAPLRDTHLPARQTTPPGSDRSVVR